MSWPGLAPAIRRFGGRNQVLGGAGLAKFAPST